MIHRILPLIRHKAWWDFKMGGFISTGLLMIEAANTLDVSDAFAKLGFLLCAIVTGAVYASLINDYNDRQSDRMNDKRNALKDMPSWLSLSMICLVIFIGMCFSYSLRQSAATVTAYLLAWLTFAMYDIRPIQLKNRGIWGALADSCGAHFFPTLFIGFGMQSYLNVKVDAGVAVALACCSWGMGFRSIVSHQYEDIHNDRKSGLRTFAVLQNNSEPVKWLGPVVLSIEVATLVYALVKLEQIGLLIALGLYMALAHIIASYTDLRFLSIKGNCQRKCRTWMISYYQSVMPLLLLGYISFQYPWVTLSIPLYIALFSTDLVIIRKDLYRLRQVIVRSGGTFIKGII